MRWAEGFCHDPNSPAYQNFLEGLAGHKAIVVPPSSNFKNKELGIVFGGYDSHQEENNEIQIFDFFEQYYTVNYLNPKGTRPEPRYEHSMAYLEKGKHLLLKKMEYWSMVAEISEEYSFQIFT